MKSTVDRLKGIGVSHDLHPKEREENKVVIEEAKREHVASNDEHLEN